MVIAEEKGKKMHKSLVVLACAAVFAASMFSDTIAKAQTIVSGTEDELDFWCGGHLDAPRGTMSYDSFLKEHFSTYFDEDLRPKWGRYDVKKNDFLSAPTVAFVLRNGFFSVQLGSLYHGLKGKIPLEIRANECYDLAVRLPDGMKRRIAFLTAQLRMSGEYAYTSPENVGKVVSIAYSTFLKAMAEQKSIVVVARLVGGTWTRRGGWYQKFVLNFEIEDYHVLE